MNLYTVKDLASETFLKPFSMPTDRDAKDGFAHVINEDETPYSKHPEDYILMSLGMFDERTGLLSVSDPKSIARAIDLKKYTPTFNEIIKDLEEQE